MTKMTPLFASRLKMLREAKGLTQSDLARAMVPLVKPQAVQKWEAGGSLPRQSRLRAIAGILNTTVDNVIRGTELEEIPASHTIKETLSSKVSPSGLKDPVRPTSESGGIPLITWDQAAEWGKIMSTLEREDAQDWLLCPYPHGPNAFVLEVTGESNYDPTGPKSYSPGDLIYVDPSRDAINRSMVVVQFDDEERAQLKQLLMDERGTRMLKSLNPNWPTRVAPMPNGASIVGVVIGKWVSE